jgi:hypothetical protein
MFKLKITIDTKEDTHEEIQKVIKILSSLVGQGEVMSNQVDLFGDDNPSSSSPDLLGDNSSNPDIFGNDSESSTVRSSDSSPSEDSSVDSSDSSSSSGSGSSGGGIFNMFSNSGNDGSSGSSSASSESTPEETIVIEEEKDDDLPEVEEYR